MMPQMLSPWPSGLLLKRVDEEMVWAILALIKI